MFFQARQRSDSPVFFLCLILQFSALVKALLETRTIDDTYGDSVTAEKPIYSPENAWFPEPRGCLSCRPRLIPYAGEMAKYIINSTWHHGMYLGQTDPPTVTFSFNGTALSVFCIIPEYSYREEPDDGQWHYSQGTYLRFILDNQIVGSFNRTTQQLSHSIEYNVSVFSQDNLENKNHTFTMQMVNPIDTSYVYFDYATYV
ncbi:hypothetical protein L218DRAFT_856393 [Marasmius fiardii PR-910]|nr:hypothetical protein L218DRAFT_856393 [Marasmius fiardii PR-910]